MNSIIKPAILLAISLLIFVAVACGGEDPEPVFKLVGTVYKIENNIRSPLPDAEVIIEKDGVKTSVKTESSGEFKFFKLFIGQYSLSVIKDGFAAFGPTQQISITDKDIESPSLELIPLGSINGVVTNAEENPEANVTIEITNNNIKTETSDVGFYSFNELSAGFYQLKAYKEGYTAISKEIEVVNGLPTKANFTIARKPSILGRVKNSITQETLSGKKVTLLNEAFVEIDELRTNAEGGYEFANLEPGNYHLKANNEGYESYEVAITLMSKNNDPINIPLTPLLPPGRVLGTVKNSQTLQFVEGAKVLLSFQNGTEVESTFTNGTGSYNINSIETGSYALEISKMGYTSKTELLIIGNGEGITKDYDLDPLSTISGTVADSGTTGPISGAVVKLSGPVNKEVSTSENGFFGFEDIPEGTYSVLIEKSGYHTFGDSYVLSKGQVIERLIPLSPIAPQLTVNLDQLVFEAHETILQLEIGNTGEGPLGWEIDETIPWLELSSTEGELAPGASPTIINASVDRLNLEHGTYTDLIKVKSSTGDVDIKVTVHVESKLCLDKAQLNFNTSEESQTLVVENCGSGTIIYKIEKDRNWIDLDQISGSISNGNKSVVVRVKREGLQAGNYTGQITFWTNSGNVVVDVQMSVSNQTAPQLTISDEILDFGTDLAEAKITITNTGNGAFNWGVTYEQTWLEISGASAGTLDPGAYQDISVKVDRSDLPPTEYHGRLQFTSGNNQEVQNVEVLMNIATNPILTVEPLYLDFGAESTQELLNVRNTGSGELQWTIKSNNSWLIPDRDENINSGNKIVSIVASREDLPIGQSSGSVTLESTDGETVLIPVNIYKPGEPPVIVIEDFRLIDEEERDDTVNPGEKVSFDVTLANQNGSDAKGLVATFSSNSPYLNMPEPLQITYGTLEVQKRRTLKVSFDIKDDVPFSEDILVDVIIRDENGITWPRSITFEVKPFIQVKDGLTTYYDFDDQKVIDLVTGLEGFTVGAQISTDSPHHQGYSYQFIRDESTFLNLGENKLFGYQNEATINFWIKTKDKGKIMQIIHASDRNDDKQVIWLTDNNRLSVPGFKFDSNLKNASLYDGNWHMLTIILSEKSQLYVDKALVTENVDEMAQIANLAQLSEGMIIGSRHGVSDSYFNGWLDNIRLYDRVLKLDEIEKLFDLKR